MSVFATTKKLTRNFLNRKKYDRLIKPNTGRDVDEYSINNSI
jgi:hypothetical protein